VQLAHLLLGDLDLLQGGRDLVERQKAPLLTIRDERPKLVQLVDRRFVSQQNFILDDSALPWMPLQALPGRLPPPNLPFGRTTS
jgi:hypothetical protein